MRVGKGVRQSVIQRRKFAQAHRTGLHRLSEDLHNCVWVDHETSYNCSEYGCYESGICRCSTIEDARVNSVHTDRITNYLLDPDSTSLIDRYCVERLLNALLTKASWYVRVVGGYYGEEIGEVTLHNADTLIAQVALLLAAPKFKRIPNVLAAEYGYVPTPLQNVKSWQVVTLPKSSVRLGNASYAARLDPKRLTLYKHYSLPKGVGVVESGGVRLLDGYHRLTAAPEGDVQIICPA